jgi:hypothetical protein
MARPMADSFMVLLNRVHFGNRSLAVRAPSAV